MSNFKLASGSELRPPLLSISGKRIINQLHPMLEYLIQNEPDRYEYEDALYMQRPYQNADTINRDFQGHGKSC